MFGNNKAHEANYILLVEKFPAALNNAEYRSTCYIAAFPEIFKCFDLKAQIHGPFDWYFDYLDDPEDFARRAELGETSGRTGPLTGQTRELLLLGLNLWNGNPFDLASGLSRWGEEVYLLALQAIDLRRSTPTFNFTGEGNDV
ncbi:MAG: DUF2538 family protein [Candidatus Pristimantibacillus sp.]